MTLGPSFPPAVRRSGRLGLLVVLAVYGFVCAANPARGGFLDAVDLAIHETGHLVFAPFGELSGFLGGTLLQLAIPLAFAAYFVHRGERFSATVPVWWAAQNLFNISVYVEDARAQVLPLVGGGEHDWTYLLGRWGLLAYDQRIGDLVHFVGVVVMVGALLGALVWLNDGLGEAHLGAAPSATDDQGLPPGERPV